MHRTSIVIVLVALVAAISFRPATSAACGNEVLRQDEAIKLLVTVERYLEKGQNQQAADTLKGKVHMIRERLQSRVTDAQALLALRMRKPDDNVKWTVDHFKERSEAKETKKDIRFRAWLAEAYAANGKVEQALEILVDLKKRDLMPDGFAYLTLAKLSAGAERDDALASCKVRAKAKSICTIPVDKSVTRS